MPEAGTYIREKIQQIYKIAQEIESAYPGRHFTPDGHMVGSMGEVVAAERYGLSLLPASAETHDAVSDSGQMIQIKTTQGKTISISSCPQYLIVLQINKNSEFIEIYNGPGKLVWAQVGKRQKNGLCSISIAKLKNINLSVEDGDRISKMR